MNQRRMTQEEIIIRQFDELVDFEEDHEYYKGFSDYVQKCLLPNDQQIDP